MSITTNFGIIALRLISYLPYFRGKGLLALMVLRLCQNVLPLPIRLMNGGHLWLSDDDPGRLLLSYWIGKYESEEILIYRRCLNHLQPDEVVIDIGANVGLYSVLAAQELINRGVGKVHAFEPNPQAIELLRKNVALNHFSHIIIQPQGVSDTNGQLNIYLNPERIGFGSMRPIQGRGLNQVIEVPVITLDNYMTQYPQQRVGLIKIDIEGGEFPALRGAVEILNRDQPYILYEELEESYQGFGYATRDLRSYLLSLGYHLYLLESSGKLTPLEVDQHIGNWQNVLACPPQRVI